MIIINGNGIMAIMESIEKRGVCTNFVFLAVCFENKYSNNNITFGVDF